MKDVITLKFTDGQELGFRYENGAIRVAKHNGKLATREEMLKTINELSELLQHKLT